MKLSNDTLLRAGMQLLLRDPPKRFLGKVFGESWRTPWLKISSFGPLVGALRNDTVVLCGVHRLDYIRGFHEVVGANGHVIAIEANPENVERLRREMADDPTLGRAKNITLIPKGVWDKKGNVTFITSAGDYPGFDKVASNQLREFSYYKVDGTKSIEIEVDALDNLLHAVGVKKVDYIVFTVNDAELLALDGVDQTIRDNPNVRFLVYSHCPDPCEEVKKKLRAKGYKVFTSQIGDSELYRIYAFRHSMHLG